MFTKTLVATTLAALVAAAPAPVPRQEASAFTLLALRSASPVQLLPINANNNKFFTGEPVTTSCPPGIDCPRKSDAPC